MPFISYNVETSNGEGPKKITLDPNRYYPARILDTKNETSIFNGVQSQSFVIYWDIDGQRVRDRFKLWDETPNKRLWAHEKLRKLCDAIQFNLPYNEKNKKVEFDTDELIGKKISVWLECFKGSDVLVITKYASFSLSEDKKHSLPSSGRPEVPQSADLDDEIPF